jgi:hypothetical protein
MRASISTSRAAAAGLLFLLSTTSAWAASDTTKPDKTLPPEEDDFINTPYTGYADYNQENEEAQGIRFLQYGRLFGVSLGTGYNGALGNRGSLWQGGFPMLDLKLHYWFDFHFAFDLEFWNANHSYTAPSTAQGGQVSVNLYDIAFDLKYYVDTKDLGAPISFASPYFILGAGSMGKTENHTANSALNNTTNALAVDAGIGLEFVIKPRSVYFELEGKIYSDTFSDTSSADFQPTLPDLSGLFYTVTTSVLFTW